MKKSVTDYPIGLLVSVMIIFLIVYYGSKELCVFLEMRQYQEFGANVQLMVDSMDYLKESNAMYSFLNFKLSMPKGQSLTFDNYTDQIILKGYFNNNISTNNDLIDYLKLEESVDYSLILCYYNCSNSLGYDMVIFR
ncbi:MAG: hypothetical protein WC376_04765 [Candidatus Nanoarchaeia archaeon]|jgi:hypothetical protein